MRWGRATASAVGAAVNSVSALARINSLTSSSGSAGGGDTSDCRDVFGKKFLACSAKSHPASAAAQASMAAAMVIADAAVARRRDGLRDFLSDQLGRDGRKTLRVGERH
jgi:hypothetical protein